MWNYEKRLQYPVNIKNTCPRTASLILSQFGGPDGELSASMRYLAQRYSMPCKEVGGLLTDIGTEELGHLEIICAMVYQLTRNLTPEQAKTAGFDAYYIDHTTGLWPAAAAGIPFNACENLIRVIDDPDVLAPLKFLRAREIVHFQRFGEALEKVKEKLDPSNYYYFNPEFDKKILKS